MTYQEKPASILTVIETNVKRMSCSMCSAVDIIEPGGLNRWKDYHGNSVCPYCGSGTWGKAIWRSDK